MALVRKHVTAAKSVTPQSLAYQMLEEAKGDMNKAAVKCFNYGKNFERLHDEVAQAGWRTILSGIIQAQRATILRERTSTAKAPFRMNDAALAAQKRTRGSGSVIKSALMEMKFQIGNVAKPLREWTGTEIAAHGETQLATARSSVRNAQFLIAVGKAAGAKTIGELGDATVERMHKEAMSSGE